MQEDIEQLKDIIHGLKMSGLSFVDQDALIHIQQRIKLLPSPETLHNMEIDQVSLKKLRQEIGEIVALIEIYGKRNEESKARSISIKGLPPRYKILKWRQSMNKNEMIRGLVSLSSALDQKGQIKLASKLIVCAKSIKIDEQFNINEVMNEVIASGNEDLFKEAGLGTWLQNITGKDPYSRGQKEIKQDYNTRYRALEQIAKYTKNDSQELIQMMRALPQDLQRKLNLQEIDQSIAAVWKALDTAKKGAEKELNVLKSQFGQTGAAPAAPAETAETKNKFEGMTDEELNEEINRRKSAAAGAPAAAKQ